MGKRKVLYEGELNLADIIIPCYVLDDGHTVEPVEEDNLSTFNKSIKQALDYNPKEKEG